MIPLFDRQTQKAIAKNKAFQLRGHDPMGEYDRPLKGSIGTAISSAEDSTKAQKDATSTASLFQGYMDELDKTTRIGNMVDMGLAAANLPFLFQKRQKSSVRI